MQVATLSFVLTGTPNLGNAGSPVLLKRLRGEMSNRAEVLIFNNVRVSGSQLGDSEERKGGLYGAWSDACHILGTRVQDDKKSAA